MWKTIKKNGLLIVGCIATSCLVYYTGKQVAYNECLKELKKVVDDKIALK